MNPRGKETRWRGYRNLLIPVAHKTDVNRLTALAALLADPAEGSVEFFHVVEQGDYATVPHRWRTGLERVTKNQRVLAQQGYSSTKRMVTADSVIGGILQEAEERNADAIALGWGPKPESSLSPLATRVMTRASCDIIIYKARGAGTAPQKLLYPIALDPAYTRLQLISRIIEGTGAELTFLHVADGGQERGLTLLKRAAAKAEKLGIQAQTRLASGKIVPEITRISAAFELMILGPSRGWWLEKTLFGNKCDQLAVRAKCSVLLHKAASEPE